MSGHFDEALTEALAERDRLLASNAGMQRAILVTLASIANRIEAHQTQLHSGSAFTMRSFEVDALMTLRAQLQQAPGLEGAAAQVPHRRRDDESLCGTVGVAAA